MVKFLKINIVVFITDYSSAEYCITNCIYNVTRCVCETQMPLIMANSKDGLGHKIKYLDTSSKILSQEMLMCNMKALIII